MVGFTRKCCIPQFSSKTAAAKQSHKLICKDSTIMNLPDNVVEVDKVQGVGFGHGKLRISRRLLNLKLWLLQMMQTHSLGMES